MKGRSFLLTSQRFQYTESSLSVEIAEAPSKAQRGKALYSFQKNFSKNRIFFSVLVSHQCDSHILRL